MSPNGEELFLAAIDTAQFLKFKAWTADGRTGSFIATIQSPLGLIFLNTEGTELKANAVRLHAPRTMYEVQRRASLRAKIPEQIRIRIQFDSPQKPGTTISYEVKDLGEGGLAFTVPEAYEKFYSRGGDLGVIQFFLAGREIQCRAVVRSRRKGRIRDGLHASIVGVQFERLHEADKLWIGAWVLRQSRYFVQNLP